MSKHKPPREGNRRAQLRAQQIAEARRRKNQRMVLGIVAGVVALVVLMGIGFAWWRYQQSQAATIPPSATPKHDGMIMNPGKARSGAPVVAIFQDYQCPACKQFEDKFGPTLEQIAAAGDIQLENHTMTFLDTNLRNDASKRAANAAVCADTVGHYPTYHDTIYKNQPTEEGVGYTDDQLTTAFAQQAGITAEQLPTFQTCYKQRTYKNYVTGMDTKAGEAGITGTPSVQVNGKTLDTSKLTSDPNSIKAAIDALAK